MVFDRIRTKLMAKGYTTDTANAKIAHDVVLDAVREAGFHDNLTVKGGVVMSGLTNVVRRATMDMDVDFLHYSLSDTAIRRFVSRLNRGLQRVFANRRYMKQLADPVYAWIEESPNDVTARLVDFLSGI